MFAPLRSVLRDTLSLHFQFSKSRLETLAILIVGIINTRTVNLSHIASQFPGEAKQDSNYRRLQRFFQHIDVDQSITAQLVRRMLNLGRPVRLALDRTNWKVGSKNINILMLAVVTRRFRVPLLWTLLDHAGNSSTDQRITLMRRYLALFGASSIELLLADREFIGTRWMNFLSENNIAFAIRLRSRQHITLTTGQTRSLKTLLRRKRARTHTLSWKGKISGDDGGSAELTICVRKLKSGEWLIIATNAANPKKAFNDYRKRWAIECLFGDVKTRGFNLEDTHITDPRKISTLVAIISLATIWTYRCATRQMGMKVIKRKSHKRRGKSWFRVGLDTLRKWLLHDPDKAIYAWKTACPKRIKYG